MKMIADLPPAEPASINGHDNAWAIRNPRDEARDLHRMVCSGACSLAEIRDLIAVPKPVVVSLIAYARRFPIDGQRIYCVLQFREKVAEEFERLIENDAASADETAAKRRPDFFVN